MRFTAGTKTTIERAEMGVILLFFIGLVVAGHKWFAFRNRQIQPQPFIVHMVDSIVVPVLVMAWMALIAIIVVSVFGNH